MGAIPFNIPPVPESLASAESAPHLVAEQGGGEEDTPPVLDAELGLVLPSKSVIRSEFPPIPKSTQSNDRLSELEAQLEVEAQAVRLDRLQGMQDRLARLTSLFNSQDLVHLLRT